MFDALPNTEEMEELQEEIEELPTVINQIQELIDQAVPYSQLTFNQYTILKNAINSYIRVNTSIYDADILQLLLQIGSQVLQNIPYYNYFQFAYTPENNSNILIFIQYDELYRQMTAVNISNTYAAQPIQSISYLLPTLIDDLSLGMCAFNMLKTSDTPISFDTALKYYTFTGTRIRAITSIKLNELSKDSFQFNITPDYQIISGDVEGTQIQSINYKNCIVNLNVNSSMYLYGYSFNNCSILCQNSDTYYFLPAEYTKCNFIHIGDSTKDTYIPLTYKDTNDTYNFITLNDINSLQIQSFTHYTDTQSLNINYRLYLQKCSAINISSSTNPQNLAYRDTINISNSTDITIGLSSQTNVQTTSLTLTNCTNCIITLGGTNNITLQNCVGCNITATMLQNSQALSCSQCNNCYINLLNTQNYGAISITNSQNITFGAINVNTLTCENSIITLQPSILSIETFNDSNHNYITCLSNNLDISPAQDSSTIIFYPQKIQPQESHQEDA